MDSADKDGQNQYVHRMLTWLSKMFLLVTWIFALNNLLFYNSTTWPLLHTLFWLWMSPGQSVVLRGGASPLNSLPGTLSAFGSSFQNLTVSCFIMPAGHSTMMQCQFLLHLLPPSLTLSACCPFVHVFHSSSQSGETKTPDWTVCSNGGDGLNETFTWQANGLRICFWLVQQIYLVHACR